MVVPMTSLWAPILLSAVFVFVLSSLIHMVLGYHANDYGKVPSEDETMAALRKLGIPPGDYFIPKANSSKDMKNPEFLKKVEAGPVGILTILPPGGFAMGKRLVMWFLYSIVVSAIAGHVAGCLLAPGTPYRTVFHVVGWVAFAGYALALWQYSIWHGIKWSTTIKMTFDGLLFALLTAGTFGWLWPR
jgi:hypothetical protein